MKIEGYASLFGVLDQAGDIVRAGAFRKSLAARPSIPLFVEHDQRLHAGIWRELREDRRGLFVRGEILKNAPGAQFALAQIGRGVDGLSIGYITRAARRLPQGRRELVAVDLLEISLVSAPMLSQARLSRAGPSALV